MTLWMVARWANLASCALAMTSLASCIRDAEPIPPPVAPVGDEHATCEAADRLCIVFRSEMSTEFETERLLVGLDHAVVFDRQGNLPRTDHVVYSGPAAGDHQVQ